MMKSLKESAELYREVYKTDDKLRDLTESALADEIVEDIDFIDESSEMNNDLLQLFLDRQDNGEILSKSERANAEKLVKKFEQISLIRMRQSRIKNL